LVNACTLVYLLIQVSQFLQTLESDLQLGVGGRLDSVLGQCMYCGLFIDSGVPVPADPGVRPTARRGWSSGLSAWSMHVLWSVVQSGRRRLPWSVGADL